MFGLFKNKRKDNDTEKFIHELALVASDFDAGIGDHDSEELMSRALDSYLENNPKEESYSAFDFYFNAFIGAFAQAAMEKLLPVHASLQIYDQVESFLLENRKYHTDFSTELLVLWKRVITDSV